MEPEALIDGKTCLRSPSRNVTDIPRVVGIDDAGPIPEAIGMERPSGAQSGALTG
jgi:hypothetical protein